MNRTVSIIVPCLNERRSIRAFLYCIMQQDFTELVPEILIADGQSDDGTRDIIRKCCRGIPRVQIVDNPSRFVSTGLNLALKRATGEIVVRMDVHTSYAPSYVRECVRALVESGAQNVGGPALTMPEGYLGRAIAAAYASPFSCGGARFHQSSYEGYVDTVTYGCWWRQTLDALGGFDEALIRNQDDELNLRIIRGGGKIWQTPRIQSWYCPRSSLKALALQYFQYGYWKVAIIRKHRAIASFRHLIPALFMLFVVLGGLGTVLGFADPEHWSGIMRAYLMIMSVYLLCTVAACLRTARSEGFSLFFALLIVFPTYHFSYGAGFLFALFRGASGIQPHNRIGFVEKLSR